MSFWDVTLTLWNGFQTSLLLFFLTLLFSLPLGLLISFGSMSKIKAISSLVKIIVWMVRGTPLMLQVIIIFYVPGLLFGTPISTRFNAAIIAFSINYACYFSEIFRGGIESISRSQYEAGQVLGLTKLQIFFRVIFLQVIKRIIPPTANEIITLVKDTALARVVMVVEIIREAEFMAARGLIWPLFYTGAFYLVFVGFLTILFGYMEKRLSYFRA
ncbi:MAG: amino acid ABC transporter permease [Treponema sp.]|nr:amino acid ABC transporter permease [Treponema sp.]